MGKVFGILMVVLGVWIGMELYTKGTQAAFGGVLAMLGDEPAREEAPGAPHRTPIQRIGDKVQGDMQTGSERGAGQTDEAALDAGDTMVGDEDDVDE